MPPAARVLKPCGFTPPRGSRGSAPRPPPGQSSPSRCSFAATRVRFPCKWDGASLLFEARGSQRAPASQDEPGRGPPLLFVMGHLYPVPPLILPVRAEGRRGEERRQMEGTVCGPLSGCVQVGLERKPEDQAP